MARCGLVQSGSCALVFLVGAQGATAQARTPAVSADSQFAAEWTVVKQRYPLVAMRFLQQKALAYQLGSALLFESTEARALVTAPVLSSAWVCALFRRLGISPLPAQCVSIKVPPHGDLADCFAPQPSAEGRGHYEMPSPEEAQACLDQAMKP